MPKPANRTRSIRHSHWLATTAVLAIAFAAAMFVYSIGPATNDREVRAQDGNAASTDVTIQFSGTSAQIDNLPNYDTYYLRVRAENSAGDSRWSAFVVIPNDATGQATSTPAATATQEPVATATQEPAPTATQQPAPTATQAPVATATPDPESTATPVTEVYECGPIDDGASTRDEPQSEANTGYERLGPGALQGVLSYEKAVAENRWRPEHDYDEIPFHIEYMGDTSVLLSFLDEREISYWNWSQKGFVRAFPPLSVVKQISNLPGVTLVYIGLGGKPASNVPSSDDNGGSIEGSVAAAVAATPTFVPEVFLHGADDWREADLDGGGIDGGGIKVGIIDSGFKSINNLMDAHSAAGNPLSVWCISPSGVSTNLEECTRNNSAHGTQVAEALLNIAPNVDLYLANDASKIPSELFIKTAMETMDTLEVSVIVYSQFNPWDGPGDGTTDLEDGVLSTIDSAVGRGIVWVNSAGNFGDKAVFYGPFEEGDDRWLDFADVPKTVDNNGTPEPVGVENNRVHIVLRTGHFFGLRWGDNEGGAPADLDLLLCAQQDCTWDNKIASSYVPVHSNADSVELMVLVNVDVPDDNVAYLRVCHRSGDKPEWVQVGIQDDRAWDLLYSSPYYTISNPAESDNPGMLAVGAARNAGTFDDPDFTIEPKSSRGPSVDGRNDPKPDVVGLINEHRISGGTFDGTSAAAPHVAGLAVLVRQRFPHYTPEQVVGYLKTHATRMPAEPGDPDFGPGPHNAPSVNNTWGWGFAHLPAVPTVGPTPEPTPTLTPPDITDSSLSGIDLRVDYTGPAGTSNYKFTIYQSHYAEDIFGAHGAKTDTSSPVFFSGLPGGYKYYVRGQSCRDTLGTICDGFSEKSDTHTVPTVTPTPSPTPVYAGTLLVFLPGQTVGQALDEFEMRTGSASVRVEAHDLEPSNMLVDIVASGNVAVRPDCLFSGTRSNFDEQVYACSVGSGEILLLERTTRAELDRIAVTVVPAATPTPTPTPFVPRGSLSANYYRIEVGQRTKIAATYALPGSARAEIDYSPSLNSDQDCGSGGSSREERNFGGFWEYLWGCSVDRAEVELYYYDGPTRVTLATIDIEVVAAPPTATPVPPTATPEPTPAPDPYGSITANRTTVDIGEPVTYVGSYNVPGGSAYISYPTILRDSSTCPRSDSGEIQLERNSGVTSKTLFGCYAGSDTVSLRSTLGGPPLASIGITVETPNPLTPSNLRWSIGETWINYVWDAPSGYTKFRVTFDGDTHDVTRNSYLASGLQRGTAYLFRVQTRSSNGQEMSGRLSVTLTTECSAEGACAQVITHPPYTSFGDGIYLMGLEIESGVYDIDEDADQAQCEWGRLANLDGNDGQVIEEGGYQSGLSVTTTSADHAFYTFGCGTWQKLE